MTADHAEHADLAEPSDHTAAVLQEFRRLHHSIGEAAQADRRMLGLWFTMLTGNPGAALGAYRTLVDDYLPWVERRLVHRARQSGSSWAGLGRLLKRSRQAVQQRHDRTWTVAELTPPVPALSREEIDRREVESELADLRRRRAADDADEGGGLVPW